MDLSSSFFSIISIFFLLNFFRVSSSEDDIHFTSCDPFNCGNLRNLSYPFWTDGLDRPAYCGYDQEAYKLKCKQNQPPVITIGSQEFQVVHIYQLRGLMRIQRLELGENTCPQEIFTYNVINYSDTAANITLFYDCKSNGLVDQSFTCKKERRETVAVFFKNDENPRWKYCGQEVEVPVEKKARDELMGGTRALNKTLLEPFETKYFAYDDYCRQCKASGGRCGSKENLTTVFVCYCRDHPSVIKCEPGRGINWETKLGIGFGAAFGGIIISCIGFFCWLRRHRGKVFFKSSFVSEKSSYDHSVMMDAEKGGSLAGVHLFSYEELEKATNKFNSDRELGDGGFGTVYYGKLRDGRAVAVKRLYENNYRRVEQFMNEVEILTRLRHKNLVSLYGCTSRHSRELLLVYEYIPKGTVADHLHGERAKPGALPWSIRIKIAIETAEALRFLHASDTIHRDVKSNNILLDNNFSVKVADFGLSRLFPTDVTHVSTTPQGTPGYVDPEYHQCYQLTDKSDVFSFGVVLVELISSKPAVDITRHRHEINLSNMAINKIQKRALHELVDPSLGFESDYKVRKMITGVAEVAFQCLQNEKDMRPTMEEVLEALMGIQNEDYNKEKVEDMDISADEVGLLKSGPLPLSPDSVMIKWISGSSTTPSISN